MTAPLLPTPQQNWSDDLVQVDSVRAKTLPGKQTAEKAYNAGLASFNGRSYGAALKSFDAAIAAIAPEIDCGAAVLEDFQHRDSLGTRQGLCVEQQFNLIGKLHLGFFGFLGLNRHDCRTGGRDKSTAQHPIAEPETLRAPDHCSSPRMSSVVYLLSSRHHPTSSETARAAWSMARCA